MTAADIELETMPDLAEGFADEEETWNQLQRIRSMPVNMEKKRELKAELMVKLFTLYFHTFFFKYKLLLTTLLLNFFVSTIVECIFIYLLIISVRRLSVFVDWNCSTCAGARYAAKCRILRCNCFHICLLGSRVYSLLRPILEQVGTYTANIDIATMPNKCTIITSTANTFTFTLSSR